MAVPAVKGWHKVTLANGQTINVTMKGDEHGHWLEDEQGKVFRLNDKGFAEPLEATAFENMLSAREERMSRINKARLERLAKANGGLSLGNPLAGISRFDPANGMHRALIQEKRLYLGKKKGIIILVNFADKSMTVNGTQARFDNMFNQVGYSENKHIGSVHDYFYDQSYGQFDLTFDVVGPVTLSKEMKYYGENDANGNDIRPCTMAAEAIVLANKLGVDFSQYDWDGDREVEQVFLIYAGYGENFTGVSSNAIWPHEYKLSYGKAYSNDGNGAMTIDGVRINTYAASSELFGSSGLKMNGIGTACHEFSHCLGYPDMYDARYGGGSAMGNWDLLDGGNYCGPDSRVGQVPAGFTAYERWMAGWMEPTELTDPCSVADMPALVDEPLAYIIYNDGNPNEAFMLENHQNNRWDRYVGGENCHGMLIVHIDYDPVAWAQNTVNTVTSHQRMTYIPADNSYGTLSGGQWTQSDTQMAGDPFPGTAKKTSFTDTSTPSAKLFNKNTDGSFYLHKPITNIKESNDGLISFAFMGGDPVPDTPVNLALGDVSDDAFTVTWDAMKYATSYSVNLYSSTVNIKPVLTEDCSLFVGSASGTDLANDISTLLDKYTLTPGWSGSKVYSGPQRMRIGSSQSASNANVCTPLITAPADGCVTICFDQTCYGSDTKFMTVAVCDKDGVEIKSEDIVLAATIEEGAYTTIHFTGIKEDYKVKFTPRKRGYIYGVRVYDGSFSKEDIIAVSARQRNTPAPSMAQSVNSTVNITVNGITDTRYTFDDVAPGKYYCRVKALSKAGESVWSEPLLVEFAGQNAGVEMIVVQSPADDRLYNLNGQIVNVKDGNLPSGIYIRNGKKIKL